jgi:hypothetical protein
MLLRFSFAMMRSLAECRNRRLMAIDMLPDVIAGRPSKSVSSPAPVRNCALGGQ